MLAERRVNFLEQKVYNAQWDAPLGLLVDGLEKDTFAKLWIAEIGDPLCLGIEKHLRFGISFDLYAQGMKPTECLAGSVAAKPVGRFQFNLHTKNLLGSSIAEYEVLDGSNGAKVASINSARVWTSEAASKLPFPRPFDVGCDSNPQTVANLFGGKQDVNQNQLPAIRRIGEPREVTGSLRFVKSQITREDFLKLNLVTTQEGITLASRMPGVIEVGDGRFLGRYEFVNLTDQYQPLPAKAGIVLSRKDKVTYAWRTGAVQSLGVAVDEGKFLQTDGYRVVGDKLLFLAVTDWAKGWAVFEANLHDFDVNVASRVTAETAANDEATRSRFVSQDGGVVHDRQTGVIWAQTDDGPHSSVEKAAQFCSKKGGGWALPTAPELKSIYLPKGSVNAKCGNISCYVSPAFQLKSEMLWSNDVDDMNPNRALIVNMVDGSVNLQQVPYALAAALCIHRN